MKRKNFLQRHYTSIYIILGIYLYLYYPFTLGNSILSLSASEIAIDAFSKILYGLVGLVMLEVIMIKKYGF